MSLKFPIHQEHQVNMSFAVKYKKLADIKLYSDKLNQLNETRTTKQSQQHLHREGTIDDKQ